MQTTVNDAEVAKFSAMAEEWWNPQGKFKPIHKFNPVRLSYIRENAIRQFGKDGSVRQPLAGLETRGKRGGSTDVQELAHPLLRAESPHELRASPR